MSLTPNQLAELRAALQSLEVELDEALRAGEESVRTVDLDQPIGRVSRIDALQQQKMAAANRQRTRSRLARVRAALGSFDADGYGLCRSCDEAISYGRLRARPETSLCIDCRQEMEALRR